jgi:nicotinamide riboside transporter PnuC
MVPQNRHFAERWKVWLTLTVLLMALLLLTRLESMAVTVILIVGYLVTLLAFEYWLWNAPDSE